MWSDSDWLKGEATISSWSISVSSPGADYRVSVSSLTENSLSTDSPSSWISSKNFQCLGASTFKSLLAILTFAFTFWVLECFRNRAWSLESNPCGVCLWRISHSAFTTISLWFRVEVCWFSPMQESKCRKQARALLFLVEHWCETPSFETGDKQPCTSVASAAGPVFPAGWVLQRSLRGWKVSWILLKEAWRSWPHCFSLCRWY